MTFFLTILLVFGSFLHFKKPKHNKNWSLEQSRLPSVKFSEDKILIENIRNCVYRSEVDFDLYYYNESYDVRTIKSVDLVLQPFKKLPLMAHLFLSFGFEDGRYLSVSVEARRQKKDKFSPFKALFKNFELIYVIADEKDIMKFKPLYRNERSYVYPLKISDDKIKNIFLDILERVNKTKENPEFYNTLTNSCVTNIFKHMKNAGEIKVPRSWKFLFPSTLDRLLYDIDLIKTNLSFDKLRENNLINKKADKYKEAEDYSQKIRENI